MWSSRARIVRLSRRRRGEMGSVLRKNQHSTRTHCAMSSRDLKLRFNLVFRLKSIRLRPCQLTAVHSTPPAPLTLLADAFRDGGHPSSRRSLCRRRLPSSATPSVATSPCPSPLAKSIRIESLPTSTSPLLHAACPGPRIHPSSRKYRVHCV